MIKFLLFLLFFTTKNSTYSMEKTQIAERDNILYSSSETIFAYGPPNDFNPPAKPKAAWKETLEELGDTFMHLTPEHLMCIIL